MNDLVALEAEFKDIVTKNIHREGIDKLMYWLGTTDFFTAPSSHRYHGAEPGGLCAHSIAVYKRLKAKQDGEDDETIAIAALFHDLCKVNFYKQSYRNVKNDVTGKWERVPSYEIEDSYPLGHGEKSMFFLMNFIKLTDDEAMAIRWHMSGFYASNPGENAALSNALMRYRLVLKLQMADQESAFWDCK